MATRRVWARSRHRIPSRFVRFGSKRGGLTVLSLIQLRLLDWDGNTQSLGRYAGRPKSTVTRFNSPVKAKST